MIPAIGSSQYESAFRRGNAMSGAPIIERDHEVREARERGDHEQEDHQRGVDRDEAVELLVVQVLHPGPRELGAEDHRQQPAREEEEDRRHDVLDPDHLVVGVDPEVVLPAARAVARVVLGPSRIAERVVGPVVEGADAGEEAERGRDQARDGDDDQPVVAPAPSRRARGSRRRCTKPIPKKSGVIHAARTTARAQQPAAPARPRRSGRRVGRVLDDLGHGAVTLSLVSL